MHTGLSNEAASVQAGWRQVLSLGEELLCLAQEIFARSGSISEIISAQSDLVIEKTAHLLEAQANLWLAEDALHSFIGKSQAGAKQPILADQPGQPPSNLMRQCLASREACFSAGESASQRQSGESALQLDAIRAVAVPLLVQDRQGQTANLLGTLFIERPGGPAFSQAQIDQLDGLAAQAAMALQSSLRIVNERWRLEQLTLVQQVNTQIANLRDLDELARRVANLILKTFNYYYVAIFTLEAGSDVLHFRASAGPARAGDSEAGEHSPTLAVHVSQGIIGHVAQSGEEILANDVQQETRYRHLDALPETRSEVALPLKVEERLLGVLDVQSDQPDYFDDTDMLVLRALAGNIALAVEGARLYSALHQRAGQLAAVYEISAAITSILDHEKLLGEVVHLIHKRLGYPYVHLFTVHPGRRKIFYEAGSGIHSQSLQAQDYTYDLDDPQGLIPWAARSGETALINDVSQEPRYRPSTLPPDEVRSELTVPLIFGGEVLGILDVQSDRLNAFGEEDRFLFEALADTIAIAMRNADLYRSEAWRRNVAESMREVAGLLSADAALDEVLDAILSELERTFPLHLAAIWLLDEELRDDGLPALQLAHMRGADTTQLDLETGLSPAEVLEFNPSSCDDLPLEQASTWLLQALAASKPVIRSPGSLYEPLGAALDYPDDYSAIAAPLRVGEHPLGVLTLAHRTSGRYGSEASAMTATFASYAAVAIENTRLYEAAHEQAWISTVLLQVAEATQSLTDLNELLATVIRITPALVGVKACLLYILDEDGNFAPAAASGLDAEGQAIFEHRRFAPGDVAALDLLVADRRPVLLHNGPGDQALAGILAASALAAEFGLPIVVPLQARGDILGALVIDYSADLLGNRGRNLEDLFDERLAIIQGIAQQTAIAVDNLRLIKSQKEEAYVSIALLQVAQAVVSSNDLDEALGSIVRITPILVGVKRTVIYLWDETSKVFRLSQSYGLPRSASGYRFSRGEFPLLDAVLSHGSLLSLPLDEDARASDETLQVWSNLETPDPEQVNEYLKDADCLLVAFPLSVKGKALGALLIEEPDPASAEGISNGNANRRLRQKRLEIITGISQQVALAIQNDQLQSEMVERERLDRELQLARNIQRTFLPQQLPDLTGWELRVHWRPAREVGGDFYDFFDLPGNRLGLVIADVADKGMPAALFMTMVRTLLRATIHQIDSPTQALEHVNEILIPDAQQGMFVTLVYAILCLETGELQVANAGHNPPLILRSHSLQLERLERGGMALGVLEGSIIQGRETILKPGDYLVMYTDGITEAFSPEGDLYGEQRLHETIGEATVRAAKGGDSLYLSAQDLLEAIDRSVAAFVGEALPSDDLTLLVLKRSKE